MLSIRAPASLVEAPISPIPAQARPGRWDGEDDAGLALQPSVRQPQSRGALTFKLLVPHSLAGLIVGYNGDTIRRINSVTGAVVQLNRPKTDTTSPEDRTLVITADCAESAGHAVSRVLGAITAGGGAVRLAAPAGGPAPPGSLMLRVVVPQPCAGAVVGPGGETVKALGARHGVWAAVEARDPRAAFHPFRLLVLASDDPAALAAAAADALSLLAMDARYPAALRHIASTCFRTFSVPTRRVGVLMGARGKHVQALQDMLRVKIGICEAPDASGCKYVSVWGPVRSVEAAVSAMSVAVQVWPEAGSNRGGARAGDDADEASASAMEAP
ncbi:hypothetical protein QBZ16_005298 [Prototheca wickerhamii]|uniref:K Homology domain-containing protein n=1 Tax=Prototheca wickerhamii TaxID=3111 RepID=A0AAD9IEC1_PROWI|nr:hypothetical protein QBZ16_005298 [Prototheca wickerhamii]